MLAEYYLLWLTFMFVLVLNLNWRHWTQTVLRQLVSETQSNANSSDMAMFSTIDFCILKKQKKKKKKTLLSLYRRFFMRTCLLLRPKKERKHGLSASILLSIQLSTILECILIYWLCGYLLPEGCWFEINIVLLVWSFQNLVDGSKNILVYVCLFR